MQWDTLEHLYLKLVEIEKSDQHDEDKQRISNIGIPWRTSGTRAFHAAVSRSLKRLEAQGFVLRQNHTSGPLRKSKRARHTRTTHVQLLPAGLKLATRIFGPARTGH
jgi:hypothetical protein